MGWNTVVLVLNDRLGEIKRDAQNFVDNLVREAGGGGHWGPTPDDFHKSQSGIIESHHADNTPVLLVGGNTATVLGFVRGYRHTEVHNQVRILETILAKYGYGIRRKTLPELDLLLHQAKRGLKTQESYNPVIKHASVPIDDYRQWQQRVKRARGMVDWLADQVEKAEKAAAARKGGS